MERYLNKNKFLNVLGIILIVYTVIFMYGMTRSAFAEADIPNEYQEVTNIELTACFLKGINPYSLKGAVGGDKPGIIYEYGPVYSLLTALLARVLPVDLIILHYALSYVSMLILGALAALLVRENTETVLPPAAAFLFMINCTWRYGYVNAVPDTLALLLSFLAIFIETRRSLKHKELFETLCIVLAFYTKIYMAYIAVPLFIYKLIKDKKAAFKLLLYGTLITGISVIVLHITCPLLFTYMIYFIMGPIGASGSGSNGSGWAYELSQLKSLGGIYIVMFSVTVLGIIQGIRKPLDERKDIMRLLVICIAASVPVLVFLGKNDGAWLSYYLQLLMPQVTIFSLIFINNACMSCKERYRGMAWIGLYVLMLIFTVYKSSKRLPYYYMSEEQRKVWDSAYQLLDECLKEGEIYYSPVFGFHAVNNDQYIYNGLAANPVRRYEGYLNTPWLQWLFKDAKDVMENKLDYKDTLTDEIKEGHFELITAIEGDDGTDRLINISDIEKGPYEYLGEVALPVSRVCYNVKLWRRSR